MPCDRVYATTGDYSKWTGTAAPPDMDRAVLARASRRIDRALIGAVYDVDDDGMPTDSGIRQALRDATCAQVEWSRGQGDIRGTGVVEQWDDVSVGEVKLSRKGGSGSGGSGGGSATQLAPAAAEVLLQEGLTPVNPWVNG